MEAEWLFCVVRRRSVTDPDIRRSETTLSSQFCQNFRIRIGEGGGYTCCKLPLSMNLSFDESIRNARLRKLGGTSRKSMTFWGTPKNPGHAPSFAQKLLTAREKDPKSEKVECICKLSFAVAVVLLFRRSGRTLSPKPDQKSGFYTKLRLGWLVIFRK